MTLLFAIVGVAVIGLIALLAVGKLGQYDEAFHDRSPLVLPSEPVSASDLANVRFGMAVRGYRMSDVDDFIMQMTRVLAARDQEVAELRTELGYRSAHVSASPPGSAPAAQRSPTNGES